MLKTFAVGFSLVLLLAAPALAQQRPQQPETPPHQESVALAYRQMGVAMTVLLQEHQRAEATLRQRIAELEKLCGAPCKAPEPAAPSVKPE